MTYASDVPPSMPVPPELDASDIRVPMFGFVFTNKGLFHDITPVGHEDVVNPYTTPEEV